MSLGEGFRRVFRRDDLERDIDDELQAHLEMKVADLEALGWSPEEARAEARARLGDVARVRAECLGIGAEARRAGNRRDDLDALRQDLGHSVRVLSARPGFSTFAVLVLALGIGSSVATFTVANGWLLKPHPALGDPDQLVIVARVDDGARPLGWSHLGFLELRNRARSFTGLAASRYWTATWNHSSGTRELPGQMVTEGYFSLLGVHLERGRDFAPEENRTPGSHPVAIVSAGLWDRLAADPAFSDRPAIRLHGQPFMVVGVAPPSFRGLDLTDAVDVWIPLAMEGVTGTPFPVWQDDFFDDVLTVVGRMAPGVGVEEASAELGALSSRRSRRAYPAGEQRLVLLPDVSTWAIANIGSGLRLAPVALAAAVVLLLACINVAGLMLVRALERRPEIACRLALGAERGRVVRQLTIESLTLVLPAAVVGLLLSRLGVAVLRVHVPPQAELAIDARVALATVLLACVVAVPCGLLPAFRATGDTARAALRAPAAGLARRRGQGLIVGAQIALTMLLLVVAGSLLRTLQRSTSLDPGFPLDGLYVAELDSEGAGLGPADAERFFARVTERVRAVPGVSEAATAGVGPRLRNGIGRWDPRRFATEQEPARAPLPGDYNEIDADFFATVGLELVAGRHFNADDHAGSERVGIATEALARELWGGDDRIGDRVRVWGPSGEASPVTVVGVVRDHRMFLLRDAPPPMLYVPTAQTDEPGGLRGRRTLLVRTTPGAGPEVAEAVVDAVATLDGRHSVISLRPTRELVQEGLGDQRLWSELTSVFGVLALVLAMTGLYATASFSVSRRTREFAIRAALGAPPEKVGSLVLRDGLAIVGLGSLVGLALGLVALDLASATLHADVGAWLIRPDPQVFTTVAALLGLCSVAACIAPVGRSLHIDPAEVLRHE